MKSEKYKMPIILIIAGANQRRWNIYRKVFSKLGYIQFNISNSFKQNFMYYMIEGK